MSKAEPTYEKVATYALISAWIILLANIYYFAYPVFASRGLTHDILIKIMLRFREAGFFRTPQITKTVALALTVMGGLMRTGKSTKYGWGTVLTLLALGVPAYLFAPSMPWLYILVTLAGYILLSIGLFILSRKFKAPVAEDDDDEDETFQQCTKLMENKYSFNLPMKFYYKHRWNNGWINIVNGARATAIVGSPGAGKTYSVFEPILHQGAEKGFSMFVYDYKYPSLSHIAYNEVRIHGNYKVPPTFGVINFSDARYTNRCNPIRPEYITDGADTTEIAELVMLNINKAAVEKEDFFSMSAKSYFDGLTYKLWKYTPDGGKQGDYCTFPHIIELMGANYKKVFAILEADPELEGKIKAFTNALEGGAQDQLQGQIASAQIPLSKFNSAMIYWVLSGNDIPLDINNPEHPMILCVGNDPKRKNINGTTIALICSQMFKMVNNPGKLQSMYVLDELPTMFLKGLDHLINTIRSNLGFIFLGMQDKSQMVRDYGEKETDVIMNCVANHIVGAVAGRTASDYSKAMGRIKRTKTSVSQGEDSESTSISKQYEDKVPVDKISTLSQGSFIGWVADNNTQKIKHKHFHCEIQRPDYEELQKERQAEGWEDIPMVNDFGLPDLRKDIEDNLDEYLYEWCEDKYKGSVEHPETIGALRLAEQVKELVEKVKADAVKLNEVREEIVQEKWAKKIDDTIDENYRKIKNDIKEMVEKEYAKVIQKKNQEAAAKKENRNKEILDRHDELMKKRKDFMMKKKEEKEDEE